MGDVPPSNRKLIVIDGNKGIAFRFHTTGNDGYPELILSHTNAPNPQGDLDLQPTFDRHSLDDR